MDAIALVVQQKRKKSFSIKEAFTYAYVDLAKDMVKPLFIGLILGALFTLYQKSIVLCYLKINF